MATKRTASAPGEADKLIAHQARLLKAPRIAEHYHRLAEQGREANWSLEDYLGAVLAVESNARAESGARQRIRYAGFPAIKTITDFDFTAQPA
ncbi:ATP-binding protein, partial [Mycolicibacterium fortuitum]